LIHQIGEIAELRRKELEREYSLTYVALC